MSDHQVYTCKFVNGVPWVLDSGGIWEPIPSLVAPVAQGRCDTTLTERFTNPRCRCRTYEGNLGPCRTFAPAHDKLVCVYCDHSRLCHEEVLQDLWLLRKAADEEGHDVSAGGAPAPTVEELKEAIRRCYVSMHRVQTPKGLQEAIGAAAHLAGVEGPVTDPKP